ncbi:MAG TPA: hypothetical protein VKB93_21340 [Thermoanaerobaculia bacterium]|nr:hypothetical protein [Thermoanaerobaculia bacterium]
MTPLPKPIPIGRTRKTATHNSATACDVIVIGTSTDPHISHVLAHLARDVSVFRLDVDRFPRDIALTWRTDGSSTLTATRGGRTFDLTTSRAVWFRRLGSIGVTPALAIDGHRPFAIAESEVLLESLTHVLPNAAWINHYDATRVSRNKIFQLLIAHECGLLTPKTLVTNSASDAEDFIANAKSVVYKTLASPRISYNDHTSLIFTHTLTPEDLKHLNRVANSSCLFQENIPKAYELRITVVGATQFAVKIFSQEVPAAQTDWRAASFEALRYEHASLPLAIAKRLEAVLRRLRLDFAAVDMIVTPDGDHVFLEANPHGAWLWLEEQLAVPISLHFSKLIAGLVDKGRLRPKAGDVTIET